MKDSIYHTTCLLLREERHEQEDNSQILESYRDDRLRNVRIIDDGSDALLSLKAFLENKSYSVGGI